MASDKHQNFAIGAVTVAPSPAKGGSVDEASALSVATAASELMPAVPFNCVVWPTGVSPLSSNAEIIRVTAKAAPSGGNVALTIKRQTSTEPNNFSRTIVVGDQIMAAITAKTLTDVEQGPPSVQTGVTYVTTGGNDANSGTSWDQAKKTIQAAIEALPEGPEKFEELENRPARVGIVEIGYGVFKEKTEGEERRNVYQPKAGGKSEEYFDPNAKTSDKGKFVYSLSNPKNFFGNEMPIIKSVNEGTHIVTVVGPGTGKGNIWGGKTPTEAGNSTTTAVVTLSNVLSFAIPVVDTKEFKATGGSLQIINEAGEAITCSYTGRSVATGAGNLEGCLVLRNGNGTKAASGAKVYYEGTLPYHTVVVFKPAIESTPGVHLVGRGKHSGPGLKLASNHGTCVEDIGKAGFTHVCLDGIGEKVGSFVGLEMKGITWKGGGGKECTAAPLLSQSRGEREGGEVIGGFFTSSNAEIAIRDCQFQEYQQVGCVIGKQSTVSFHCEFSFFMANGRYETEWMEGTNMPSAGLWLVKSPNQGVLINNRYNGNFGVGLLNEGGIGFFNDEHSHNFKQSNTTAPQSGCGLVYNGATGSGIMSGLYGWGEGNDLYEIYVQGNGTFTLLNYTFRGAVSKNFTSEPTLVPVAMQTGSGKAHLIGCEFMKGYWPEKNEGAGAPEKAKEKAQEVWLIEPGSGDLRMVGCILISSAYKEAEQLEKGIKKQGVAKIAYSRPAMTGSIELPSKTLSAPEASREETITAGTAWQNKVTGVTPGSDVFVYNALETTEAEATVEILMGPTEAGLAKIYPVLKFFPTVGVTPLPAVRVPYGWWLKYIVVKGTLKNAAGTANKANLQPL